MQLPQQFLNRRRLDTLVENKTSYTLRNVELNIYETHQRAERVLLTFSQPVLASMIEGKKVMNLSHRDPFPFLPGESLILPGNEPMCIDFPEANQGNPTRCLAMTFSDEIINAIMELMNEEIPKCDLQEWKWMENKFHFTNDPVIHKILQRLLFLFTEDHPSKDFFVENMLKELIIRILQSNARNHYAHHSPSSTQDNRLAYVIQFIRDNLDHPLNIELLSKKACMSQSHFYRVFRNELGISPMDFINNERIKLAVSLLQNPNRTIKEVYMECGFESRSYFNRVFKRIKKVSPSAFQSNLEQVP